MAEDPNPQPDPQPDPQPEPDEKTFTQAQLDAIVKDRVAREKAKTSDYDELKKAAEKLAELEAADASEAERLQAQVAQLEKDLEAARGGAKETSFRAAVIAEAAKRNLRDPDAAVALIDRNLIEYDDDGAPKQADIVTAMDSLLERADYLLPATGGRGNADQGARGGSTVKQVTRDELQAMTPEQRVKARQEGRLDELLGVNS